MRGNKLVVLVCMCNLIEGPVTETTRNLEANTTHYNFASDILGKK